MPQELPKKSFKNLLALFRSIHIAKGWNFGIHREVSPAPPIVDFGRELKGQRSLDSERLILNYCGSNQANEISQPFLLANNDVELVGGQVPKVLQLATSLRYIHALSRRSNPAGAHKNEYVYGTESGGSEASTVLLEPMLQPLLRYHVCILSLSHSLVGNVPSSNVPSLDLLLLPPSIHRRAAVTQRITSAATSVILAKEILLSGVGNSHTFLCHPLTIVAGPLDVTTPAPSVKSTAVAPLGPFAPAVPKAPSARQTTTSIIATAATPTPTAHRPLLPTAPTAPTPHGRCTTTRVTSAAAPGRRDTRSALARTHQTGVRVLDTICIKTSTTCRSCPRGRNVSAHLRSQA